jgi:NADH-quinone oxidoreductase subunit J
MGQKLFANFFPVLSSDDDLDCGFLRLLDIWRQAAYVGWPSRGIHLEATTFMTFDTAQAAFYYLATASVASAVLAVSRKNPVHSMLWVLALFLHVAGIFLLVGAEFLAAVQTIVYAGAILVFYLFVLMLLDLPGEEARPAFATHWPLAAAGGLGFVALAWLVHVQASNSAMDPDRQAGPDSAGAAAALDAPAMGSLAEVGKVLFGPFALPFEIAGLVLLAAIVGAVVLVRRRTDG